MFAVGGMPLVWEARVVGALLWAGPDTYASHAAAARLWGLSGFERAGVEITSARRLKSPESVKLHSQPSFDSEIAEHGPFRISSAARTLIDLGSVIERSRVEIALDQALRKGLVTLPRLQHALDQRGARGRKGAAVVRDLLGQREPDVKIESVLERKLLNLLRSSGIELPQTQFKVFDSGELVARLDFAYPERLVAIEADGFAYHSGRVKWQLDVSRRNWLTSLGWLVIHVTWEDVTTRPEKVIDSIRNALRRRPL